MRILILGGTSEARQLAGALAGRSDCTVTLSLAGRTQTPAPQPVPVRSGGFGGVDGLARYLRDERVDVLIDATHPYADTMAAHAAEAAARSGVAMLALKRPAWMREPGDRWIEVDGVEAAVMALGETPRRVFLTIGRNEVHAFQAASQNFYLVRSVDAVEPPLRVAHAEYLVERGPFDETHERALLEHHRIDVVVAKNSGGDATHGKIAAARALGFEVVMIERPMLPQVTTVKNVSAALAWLDHHGSTARGE